MNAAILRILLAIIAVIVAGLWGMISFFSDYPPQWSLARWALHVLSGHIVAGFLIGMLIPLRWQLSIAGAWGATLMAIMGLISMVVPAGADAGPPVPLLTRLAAVLTLFAVPAVLALAAYAGSRIVTRRWRSGG